MVIAVEVNASDCTVREYAQIKDMDLDKIERQIKSFEKYYEINARGADKMLAIGASSHASRYMKEAETCRIELEKLNQVLYSKDTRKK